LAGTGIGFKEKAYSSSAIGHMVKEKLREAGDYRGQTTHGSRRGKMQHDHYVLGKPLADVMRKSHIKTLAVGKLYVDRHAHVPFHA